MLRILHKLHLKTWIFVNYHLLSCPSHWQQQWQEGPGLCIFLACLETKKEWTWLCSKFLSALKFPSVQVMRLQYYTPASLVGYLNFVCEVQKLFQVNIKQTALGNMNLFGGFYSIVWKALSIVSISLFEKLQLFCRVKNYVITNACSNSHVLPAAIPGQGAGWL